MKKLFLLFLTVCSVFILSAKEGMWIPVLLEKYNFEEMQEMGFKLTAGDIYHVNHSSMKDAVVLFGRGCTGELISDRGLLITNHHCGYRQIQSHSSVNNDYLTNGFWAMNATEELPNPGLTVSFLEFMEDVTEKVFFDTNQLNDSEKINQIEKNIERIKKEAQANGKFKAEVKPLFYGNRHYLYVYKIYRDIRLVGAPPSAIGKFGGDTDNWMWPRHTGDFSLFRIYADKNNEPADYSPDNVPYKPKKYFPISIKGVQPEDFTMVFGYPGTTTQYWPSQAVKITMDQRNPDRIKIRDKKLQIIAEDMNTSSKVRIQYAAKYAGISNSWKKWQGEIKGLERLDAVNKKIEFEEEFKKWAKNNETWENTYEPVFENLKNLYAEYARFIKSEDIYAETITRGADIFRLAATAHLIVNFIENKQHEKAGLAIQEIKNSLPGFYKDYNQSTDEKLFAELIPVLANQIPEEFLPFNFKNEINDLEKDKLVKKIYRKSVFINQQKLMDLFENGTENQILKLRNDPVFSMYRKISTQQNIAVNPHLKKIEDEINNNMQIYVSGILEMKKGQPLYPDANLTLRVAYGKVEGYEPGDGVIYKHFTTLKGILEKDNPEIYDYDVPEKLKELAAKKEFGEYEENGTVPVCFTASNHTTGGNSGSPVINANGELIGINFDRCWEGTMSDIMYDPEQCRNIALDIRYALFIIEKFAGAGYLLNEMNIVSN